MLGCAGRTGGAVHHHQHSGDSAPAGGLGVDMRALAQMERAVGLAGAMGSGSGGGSGNYFSTLSAPPSGLTAGAALPHPPRPPIVDVVTVPCV